MISKLKGASRLREIEMLQVRQHTILPWLPSALSYNVIHPVPPFDNEIVQSNAFDYIDNAGMHHYH